MHTRALTSATMLQTLIQPSGLPLSIDEARLQVKQDITADDPLLRRAIQGAAAFAESQTERTLLATRLRLVLDSFPGPSLIGVPFGETFSLPAHAILLPRSPLLQLVDITYLDLAGVWQTMPPADYTVDDSGPVVRITPIFGKIWPIPKPQIGAVRVTFDAGYATAVQAAATENTLTFDLWKPLAVGDPVRFSNSGGALPAPLQPSTNYYVQAVNGNALVVSATAGGAAIDLTDVGSGLSYLGEIPDGIVGWMLVRINSLFTHRGETAVVNGKLEPLPYVDRLLDPYRVAML